MNAESAAVSCCAKAALRTGDPSQAIPAMMEIIKWLDISTETFMDFDTSEFRRVLRKSPLAKCNPNNAASVLSALADAASWMGRDECVGLFLHFGIGLPLHDRRWLCQKRIENAYRVALNWLLLDLPEDSELLAGDFSDVTELRSRLWHSHRLLALYPGSAICVISAVADLAALAGFEGGTQDACMLLESWLDEPMGRFLNDKKVKSLDWHDIIALANTWLKYTLRRGPEFIEFCSALVSYIRFVRDDHLASLEQRREFLKAVDRTGYMLKLLCLNHAQHLRKKCNDSLGADSLERHMFEWLEQIEYRQLVEDRFHSYNPASSTVHQNRISGKEWPFLYTTDEEDPKGNKETPLFQQMLGASNHPASKPNEQQKEVCNQGRLLEERRQELLNRSDLVKTDLDHLIPPGCLWIRVDFDHERALSWSAYYRPEDGGPVGTRLHGGQSEPDALARLEVAVSVFDMAIEAIWASYRGFVLRPKVRIPLLRIAKYYIDHGPREDEFNSTEVPVVWMDELRRAGWHKLASVGEHLIKSSNKRIWLEKGRLPKAEAKAFSRFIESFGNPWPEPHGSTEREIRRKEQLDAVTDQLLSTVREEFDGLDGFHGAGHRHVNGPIDWSRTDVLFKVAGPLLAVPLTRLPFGPEGDPICESVASVSTIVSLTLRAVAESEARDASVTSDQILSAHFLKEDEWKIGARGLADLHAELSLLCHERGWRIVGFGDDPAASVDNIKTCLLGEKDRGFRLVVIGGHGDIKKVGVSLSDAVWQGDGPLHQVGLVILCACAVGRLNQPRNAYGDAEGLSLQVVANGGRCVLAAKNPVADREAARFLARFVREFIATENGNRFAAARAMNQTRKALAGTQDTSDSVSTHLMDSFELLGTT